MHWAGDTLLYLPHHYAPDMSENEKAVCTACECYALAWISDICGTIPTMLAIEPREAHDSLSTFAQYTLPGLLKKCNFSVTLNLSNIVSATKSQDD